MDDSMKALLYITRTVMLAELTNSHLMELLLNTNIVSLSRASSLLLYTRHQRRFIHKLLDTNYAAHFASHARLPVDIPTSSPKANRTVFLVS